MSSDSVDTADDGSEWDYLCPQYCDLTATETTDQLRQMDHFFECNHEMSPQTVGQMKAVNTSLMNGLAEQLAVNGSDVFGYETPPQNKENAVDDDNEIFYSTKKYLTLEDRPSYKLRATPMRTLQHNGGTPLRETRTTSSKKKYRKYMSAEKRKEVIDNDKVYKMDDLIEALPTEEVVETIESIDKLLNAEKQTTDENQTEEECEARDEERIETECEEQIESQSDAENEMPVNDVNDNAVDDEVFDSNDRDLTEAPINMTLTGRESYVIEKIDKTETKKPQKSVTLISPDSAAKKPPQKSLRRKGTPLRKSILCSHRKGTPIRKSILSSQPRPRTQDVVMRLYSTAKKPSTNGYKTMAELCRDFETQPRVDHRSHSQERNGMGSRSSSITSLTRPKSPKFHSVPRHRNTPRPTEDIIASQIKKYSFKANPIRKKLFDAKFASGIPRVKSAKEPTKAVGMHFQTDRRLEVRAVKLSTTDDKPEAQPKITFKANPMPEFKSFKVHHNTERKATTFKPFSFDHKIQNLVQNKKRTLSDDLHYSMKREVIAKPFKF